MIITPELRCQKRNIVADVILENRVFKYSEAQLIQIVKDIETKIYTDHPANSHLYNSRIANIIQLFKMINIQNLYYIADKLRRRDLQLRIIEKFLDKRKQLPMINEVLKKKSEQKSKVPQPLSYDPLGLKPVKKPKIEKLPTEVKVTLIKPKETSGICQIYPRFHVDKMPSPEIVQQQDSDEEVIRLNDGLQGSNPEDKYQLFASKQIQLIDKKQSIPIILLTEIPSSYRSYPVQIEVKLFPAEQTIEYLKSNLDRSIVYGQVQMRQCDSSVEYLYNLANKLLKTNRIVAAKYDDDNATIVLLHYDQLQVILKPRKYSVNAYKTGMVIKEWANDSYLKWWAAKQQFQDHQMFFLIYFKELRQTQFRTDKLTLLNPSHFPQIQAEKEKQDNDFLLKNFFKIDYAFDSIKPVIEPLSPIKEEIPEKVTEISVVKEPIQNINIPINIVGIELDNEDYF